MIDNNREKKFEINWRSLVENIPERIITLDRNGIILFINRTSPNRTVEEVIGKSVYSFLPTDEQKKLQKILYNLFETGKSCKYISKIIRNDGSEAWYEIKIAGIKENGKIIAALVNSTDITELKLFELKLNESEEKHRNLIDNLTDIVVEIDFEGNLSYISSQITQILGYSPEELIGTNGFQFIHPNDIKEIRKKHEIAIKAEIPIYYEYKARHKDGHYVPMSLHVNYLKIGDKGKITGILRDNSEKIKIEQRLREAEQKYRIIFEKSSNAIVLLDLTGKIIECNLSTVEMFGYSKEEIVGQNYLNLPFYSEIMKTTLKERFKKISKGIDIKPQILEIKRKDGKLATIKNKISYLKIGDQNFFQAIIQDITEQKKIEEELKESEEKFRTIADQSLIGIDILQDGKEIYVNEALSTIVGYPIEEIRNWKPRDYHKLIHSEDLKSVFESIAKGQDGKTGSIIGYHCRIITKKKKVKWVEVLAKLIMFRGKRAILSSTIDITAKMEAEQKLKEINQMKSELLRRTSHELKTPLVSIKGFSDLLLRLHYNKLDTDVISLIDEIKQGCTRLENLIGDILKTSELDLGKVQLKKEMDDLAFLIRFSIKELRALAEIRNQIIETNIHDNLITKFEKERIHEVLGNLITNAIKYTPPKGRIKIQTEIKNGFYIVSVNDNGIGFTKKELSKLFTQFGKIERFGQGLDVISEGSGLGLFISKKIIELHGGEIWVDSEGRNKGSTFYFSLPIIKD